MRTAIYPGSFDPVTNGHIDLVERALHLFDRVVFAIAPNEIKKPLFTAAERLALAQQALERYGDRVEVTVFEGLLVRFVQDRGATTVVRGLRAVADFEFEFQLALMNRKLLPGIETVFLMPRERMIYVSSSLIKEVARLGGCVREFVPEHVAQALAGKFGEGRPMTGRMPGGAATP
jgi:pantetheine-phosphate adenylyltransferase